MGETLELGAGQNPIGTDVTLDLHGHNEPDVVHDLEEAPWPFDDDRFSEVYMHHALEHVAAWKQAFHELHRITEPGGIVQIRVPHYSGGDGPDHETNWSLFDPEKFLTPGAQEYIGDAHFSVVERNLRWRAKRNYETPPGSKTGTLFNVIGRIITFVVNRPVMWNVAERFCYWFSGFEEIEWRLEVVED